MRRLRTSSATLVLAGAILIVFAAVAVNVPQSVHERHWKKRDRQAFAAWVVTHGGNPAYGVGYPEPHSRYDVVCAPHYPPGHHARADYKIYLLIDSHGNGRPRVVRAVRGPLTPRPTDTGPKCGRPPTP